MVLFSDSSYLNIYIKLTPKDYSSHYIENTNLHEKLIILKILYLFKFQKFFQTHVVILVIQAYDSFSKLNLHIKLQEKQILSFLELHLFSCI